MRLVDSDVIIWNWRSQAAAAALLAAEPFAISAVTYMELVQGMRNARELKNLRADLVLWQTIILPITKSISERAVKLVEEHFLAHHLKLADAIIAATAIEHRLAIVTSNIKHFRIVKTLRVEAFTPR
jgi:predicted nucleic acid-binding protein